MGVIFSMDCEALVAASQSAYSCWKAKIEDDKPSVLDDEEFVPVTLLNDQEIQLLLASSQNNLVSSYGSI